MKAWTQVNQDKLEEERKIEIVCVCVLHALLLPCVLASMY